MGLFAAYDVVYRGVLVILEVALSHKFDPVKPYVAELEKRVRGRSGMKSAGVASQMSRPKSTSYRHDPPRPPSTGEVYTCYAP